MLNLIQWHQTFSTAFMKWLIPEKLENFLLWWEHPLLPVEPDTGLESQPKHSVVTIINAINYCEESFNSNFVRVCTKIYALCWSTLLSILYSLPEPIMLKSLQITINQEISTINIISGPAILISSIAVYITCHGE